VNRSRSNLISCSANGATRLVCVACVFFFAGMLFQSRLFRSEPVEAASDHLVAVNGAVHVAFGLTAILFSDVTDTAKPSSDSGFALFLCSSPSAFLGSSLSRKHLHLFLAQW
jgi:hypothetical protein